LNFNLVEFRHRVKNLIASYKNFECQFQFFFGTFIALIFLTSIDPCPSIFGGAGVQTHDQRINQVMSYLPLPLDWKTTPCKFAFYLLKHNTLAPIVRLDNGVKVPTSGVNFTNILHTAFTCADPKSAKNTVKLLVFYALWDLHV